MTISIIASQLSKSLIKNKGVQAGIGLSIAGFGASAGLGAFNETAKDVTNPLGLPSGVLIIGAIVLLLVVMRK